MAELVALLLFISLAGSITYYGYRKYARPARFAEQLGSPIAVQMPQVDKLTEQESPGLVVSVLEQIGEKVPISPADAGLAKRDLMSAGYRSDKAVPVFYGIKIAATVLLLVAAFLFRDLLTSNSILRIVILFAAGGAGFFGPQFMLEQMIGSRQERLRLALPDALDLMVVSVEAGLALDQAVQYVARELQVAHPDLSDEFSLVTLEMRAGKRRPEALKNLAERTGEDEIRKLVAILVQTDRFGTSVAESLRTHSDFMRVRRRQEAEERANKVGVKLVFPIFFFILPSMLMVTAGPGILQVVKYLLPMMKNFGQ